MSNPINLARVLRIGLVDDDLSVRRSVGRLLRTHGYACATYDSGETALADPDLSQTDCLVVDIHLGGINGLELCERVAALGFKIPHIFITVPTANNAPEGLDRLKGHTLLTKPFEENDLIESIQRVMSEP